MRIGIIGGGTIARLFLEHIRAGDLVAGQVVAIVGRSDSSRGKLLAAEVGVPFVTGIAALLACSPEVVVEAASHEAVRSFGPPLLQAGVALVVLSGFWICGAGARRLGVHDHPAIVWDEIAGMMITMLAAPRGLRWAVLAFALFRLFDIVKPWPIRVIDHGMRGGAGIMLDDVMAGFLAALGLLLVRSIT